MCGIAGFTHGCARSNRGVLNALTGALYHRGPNHQAGWISESAALAAVRLSVIDQAAGAQPLVSADGDTVVVFNGEVYNHAELREELERLGHGFRTRCDTEVVLEAFRAWGTAAFARLRGMFAAAFWTESEKRLVLLRDRTGIKPLYYRQHRGELYFGSELKAIFEHPRLSRRLDLEALQDYLSLGYVPGDATLVQGIRKVPPAHFLEFRRGKLSAHRYWEAPAAIDRRLSFNAAAEHLDHLLGEAVREQLAADAPLGFWLSGGLDSSTILQYAAASGFPRLRTFSIAFENRSCDERRYFREMAACFGTEHYELELGADRALVDAVEDFAFYSDEPGADAGAVPVWFLAKMTSRHVTVALSGDGGDELFGGYLTYQADRLARPLRAVPAAWRRFLLRALHDYWPPSDAKVGLDYKTKRLLEGSLLPPDEAHLFWNGLFSAAQKQTLLPGQSRRGLAHLFGDLPRDTGTLNRYMALDQRHYLTDNILYKVDRMSMAHSLEVRPPFLDHRIVELAATLPQSFKIQGACQKRILRAVVRGKLPEPVLQRRKEGFDIPAHQWFRGPLRELLLETLTPEAIGRTKIFDVAATEALIRDHLMRHVNVGYHLWSLVTLFLWLTRWNIEVVPARQRENPARNVPLTSTI